MPAQQLSAPSAVSEPTQTWRLAIVVVSALIAGALAARQSHAMLSADGMSLLEWLVLGLFTANFALVAMAAVTAVVGVLALVSRPAAIPTEGPLSTRSRTAIVFPMRNEAPDAVMGAASAVHQALVRAGAEDAFDLFFLSDTRDLELARVEHRVFERLRASHPDGAFYYRRRANNTGRKAGNMADFVRRWGGRYDYMVVFDADSLMSAEALVELVRRMDNSPRTALIQTVPMIVNATSLFARTQQFAMRAYGQIFGAGIAWWSGHAGNFWGHNAIIRVSAFAAHADLPRLPENGPFGGEILSHDFVEAGLLRRAGWRVEIATDIAGSYEGCPPTLLDMAARDRRWVRGNLQHVPLIGAQGFDPATRMHFLAGVLGYLSSPMWLGLIASSLILALVAGDAPSEGAVTSRLVAATALVLFLPKVLALGLWAFGRLPGWPRTTHFLGGFLFELLASALIAPVTMVTHSLLVVQALTGSDIGWNAQQRSRATGLAARDVAGPFLPHLIVGLCVCLLAMSQSVAAAIWMAPIWASLVLAAPLSLALGRVMDGQGALSRLLATPEEASPPAILRSAEREAAALHPDALPGPRMVAAPASGPALVLPASQQDAAGA